MTEAKKNFDLSSINKPLFGADPFIVDGSLKNRRVADACIGYSFQIGSLSYRGVWVSTIESVTLKVDGEEIPQEKLLFCVNGKKFLATQLPELFAEFWHPLEPAELLVYQVGGLAPGAHEIDLLIMRHNDFGYSHEFVAMPNHDSRTMTL